MGTILLIWLTINLIMLGYGTGCDRYRRFISGEKEDYKEIKMSKETVGCIGMIFPLLPMRDMLLDAIKNRK